MVSYGYPLGYFGFNESHALKLSFAAWSPILLLPWVIWGWIFGWTMMSPIYSNIFFLGVALFVFVKIVKPSWKQLGILFLLFCCYTPFTRYMLSGMPEIICFSLVIIYFACLLSYIREEKTKTLVALFLFSVILTLMRPYLILFLLFPIGALILRKKWWGVFISACILGMTGIGYVLIKHYFGAEYFTPLFKTEWLSPLLEGNLLGGIKGIFVKLYYEGKTFLALTIEGFRSGMAEGAIFIAYLVLILLFIWQAFSDYRNKRKRQFILHFYLTFCYIAMLIAILLMYKMKEGSKHLITFIVLGIFAVAMMHTRFYKKAMIFCVLSILLFSVKAYDPIDYALPIMTIERQMQIATWSEVLEDTMELQENNVPNYDNVVIWTLSDLNQMMQWQVLYALPAGFGISCSEDTFIIEQFENLQSKYIVVPTGGQVEALCIEYGKKVLIKDEIAALYQLREDEM